MTFDLLDPTPLGRRRYVTTGLALMALKLALDFALVYLLTGQPHSLLAFFVPFHELRSEALKAHESAAVVLVVAALPFLFVGLSYSIRRALDAGLPPVVGLFFAAPILNYLVIALLSALPSRPRTPRASELSPPTLVRAATLGIASLVVLGLLSAAAAAALGEYGAGLFFASPVLAGVASGWSFNRIERRTVGQTLLLASVGTLFSMFTILLFALEGAVCLFMVLPLALPLVLLGALVGRQLAAVSTEGARVAPMLLLPLAVGGVERLDPVPLHHVVTSVEVDATPAQVFDAVVSFPPITSERPWYFRTGIAVPLSARLVGEGVGAVRHCEFTTGAFVEPITAWEPGRRLAFDVTSQPAPMEEWSPYAHLDLPHLHTTMRSRRGEFRMVPLPSGRTRLEGHTYYELGLRPDAYFRLAADALLHRIHQRVLEHVRDTAETRARQ